MYTAFYNLNKKPFQISSDPSFMWFGEKHKEALATLKYGILDNKGFLLLTGDVGTGKTTLINALHQSLEDNVICATVPDPGLEKLDFLNYIAAAFGIEREFASKGAFLAHFRKFLLQADKDNKKVLLIIDESQLLTQEMLEEIRLLSNIEKMDAKLINIFFVGQNEFNEILNKEQNRAVRQRLTLNYNIDPLTPDETASYIKFRLKVAGADYTVFNEGAAQEVFLYSGGFPRRINVICDHCLLSGYVNEQKIINASIVKECAAELKIPSHIPARDIARYRPPVTGLKTVQDNEKKDRIQIKPVEENKKAGKLTTTLTVFLLFILIGIVWFWVFPEDFHYAKRVLNQYIPYEKSVNLLPVTDENKSRVNDNTELPEPLGTDQATKAYEKDSFQTEIKEPVSIEKNSGNEEEIVEQTQTEPGSMVIKKIQELPPEDTPDKDKKTSIQPETVLQHHLATTSLEQTPQKKDHIVPEEVPPLPEDTVIIRFKYNTNDFTKEGYGRLEKFSKTLVFHPGTVIMITGYTDSEGYEKYNRKLSEFRANIVRSFLLGKGVRPDQMLIQGLGSKNPIESNDTVWGRMMNRRVEIEVQP